MIQNYNIYKVLKIFLDDPLRGFKLRAISRILKLGLPSVSNYVKELEKKGLIVKKELYGSRLWFGNRESRLFKAYKRFDTAREIEESGLIGYLEETLSFPAVVLYGSHALGEDRKESDIDLFIIASSKKEINAKKFEKILGKELHIFVHTDTEFQKLKKDSKELINNVLNGIVLSGYMKVL